MRGGIALAVLALASGCATSRVTLLDNEPGHEVGAVAVLDGKGGETVLDAANSEAKLTSGPTRIRARKGVRPADLALIGTLPPPARTFTLLYETGQSAIRDDQREVLEQIRAELASRPGAQIEVAAFTDSVGSEAENARLSLDRARKVADELRASGFMIDAEDAVGRGEYEAVMRFGDNQDLPAFRRVEVIVR